MVTIRAEQEGGEAMIHELTTVAFAPMPFCSGTEATIIDRLRSNGELTIALLAVDKGQIVGHIAFSLVTLDNVSEGWYGLGPISVHPTHQGKGIGRQLVEEGLAQLKARENTTGCVFIGNPDPYHRFGFRSSERMRIFQSHMYNSSLLMTVVW